MLPSPELCRSNNTHGNPNKGLVDTNNKLMGAFAPLCLLYFCLYISFLNCSSLTEGVFLQPRIIQLQNMFYSNNLLPQAVGEVVLIRAPWAIICLTLIQSVWQQYNYYCSRSDRTYQTHGGFM